MSFRTERVARIETGVTGAVFYEPGSLLLPSGRLIEFDQPVAMLVEEAAGRTVVTLSSPEQKTGIVRVELSVPNGNAASRKVEQNISLPPGNRAGSSVNVEME